MLRCHISSWSVLHVLVQRVNVLVLQVWCTSSVAALECATESVQMAGINAMAHSSAREIGDGAAPKGATATAARVRRPPRRGGGARRARDRVAPSPAAAARRPCPC